MEGKVLTKEELENTASKMGFSLIEIECEKSCNKIEIANQNDFLDFHEHVENLLLFYYYDYEDKMNFMLPVEIPEEYNLKQYPKTIIERISTKIKEYNTMINETDFNTPSGLTMHYIKDGFLFYNYVFEEPNIFSTYDEIINEVLQDFPSKELDEMKKIKQEKIKNNVQELKEIIFADPNFKVATNPIERKIYAKSFFDNNPTYVDLLNEADWIPVLFIHHIWKEFKSKGLHKKRYA
ncbi:hypothetical protein ACFUP3_21840 [Bacillus paralicheniformis]|uniref:hypothetical protein n=1 Tax=Bacillus paralicheniformis TaxID=1648923 RepID=UPI0036348BCC